MNVFEDLIVELKEENLLENSASAPDKQKKTNDNKPKALETQEESKAVPAFDALAEALTMDADPYGFKVEVIDENAEEPPVKRKKAKPGKEYFNKRAVDETSALQMVEHVLTGVEREYMKVVPKAFDDFNAKKALHVFINIAETADSEEHKTAEFALMRETEAWSLALLDRDEKIGVSLLRQYCDNTRPALSSQAMLALARFYRNAPYSESVRAKFDFVITRLFSRPAELDKRVCLFTRNEMLTHINKLYSEWSSVPLYDAEEDDSNVMLTGLSFDDLAIEAEAATSFDRLIESDFFGRLRLFKESINELFFAPTVTASAIESNVRIGNAYVSLIVKERQKLDAASIQLKYIEFNGQSVSDAAGQELNLPDLLNVLTDDVVKAATEVAGESKPAANEVKPSAAEAAPEKKRSPFAEKLIGQIKGMNKVLIGACILLLLATSGLYFSSAYVLDENVSTAGVQKVDLDNSPLSEHIKTGRISGDTFYGLLLPSWDALPKEKREEFLQKVLQIGEEKGYKQVNLTNKSGKAAGYASATRLEVNMP